LYIPLGGNRAGNFRTYVNIMITMLIGGLWHGANWTFVAWGGIHGIYLWVEKAFRDRPQKSGLSVTADRLSRITTTSSLVQVTGRLQPEGFPYALLTFLLICITWVFFRSATFGGAWLLLRSMFGQADGAAAILTTIDIIKVAVVIGFMLIFHWTMRNTSVLKVVGKMPWWLSGIAWSVILILIILSQGTSKAFIYFQF
jgi:D-alanyl-lipoteichoic acid acyltransferase DltB (MBOAT superfamily)